ncbi:hypothetical protein K501DRAFT_262806 [Backusella circina FSU 941]|nr:hypothetical protein K501DRAFT_262806 [Backusella circina FSU 941]
MLLITSADEYLGYCITAHLSKQESLRKGIRVLCSQKERCLGFARKGIDVREVIADHPHQTSHAMRNIDLMILILPKNENRVKECLSLCDTAIRSGVKSILFLSTIGASCTDYDTFSDYQKIESKLLEVNIAWSILRLDWIQQHFHLWATQIEEVRSLHFPFPNDIEFCPIDITDVCNVIQKMVTEEKTGPFLFEISDSYSGQIFTLTGPEATNGKKIVQMMSSATNFSQLKYQHTRLMDVRYYLESLSRNISFYSRVKKEDSQRYHDELDELEYRKKAYVAPNYFQIQEFIDYFDWITKTSSSIPVDHVKVITNNDTRSLQDFFNENANSFKPRV